MKNKEYLLILLFFISCISCKQQPVSIQDKKNVNEKTETTTGTFKAAISPEVPFMITDPGQRVDYLVKHYWDQSDFTDTLYLRNQDVTEQAWVDFYDLLNYTSLHTAKEAIKNAFAKANRNKKIYLYFTELADKYLYDPNSPIRNEEFYIPVLESLLESPLLNDTEKIRPKARLKLAYKNRPGTSALDFTYTLASGVQGTLHNLKADYTILFINNPGCQACSEAIAGLKQSAIINHMQTNRKLKILAFYTDTDLDEWWKHRSDFPDTWINSYDKSQNIVSRNLYDLKAIPTFYLLDKQKTVLLKDATLPLIEEWLSDSEM